jgi:GNAT superfamily N-acetyltransferase
VSTELRTGTPPRLADHLTGWLGSWPAGAPVEVVGWPGRQRPGWDGRVHPALAVSGPAGTVLSVAPDRVPAVRALAGRELPALRRELPRAAGSRSLITGTWVFRWCTEPAALPEAGSWRPADDPGVPDWMRVFGGEVLLALDPDGAFLAGVGLKRHDRYGRELAVVTAREARGSGLGRRLVAQAARRVLDEGGVPTYLHDPANVASGRVAAAAGFPDRGWTGFGAVPRPGVRERVRRWTGR